nr:hypothetical protein [Tanacetum cinerariifolium]
MGSGEQGGGGGRWQFVGGLCTSGGGDGGGGDGGGERNIRKFLGLLSLGAGGGENFRTVTKAWICCAHVAFHAIKARRLPLAPLVYTLVRHPMTTSSANNSVFKGFFEKQKLTRPKFIDWYRQLRIVLSIEDKLNYLEQPIPPASVAPKGQQVAPEIIAAHTVWIKRSKEIVRLMLMTIKPEIQRNLENLHAHEMSDICERKTRKGQNRIKTEQKREAWRSPKKSKAVTEEGQSVSSYILKMKSYIDNLERLRQPVTLGLGGLRESRKLKPGNLSLYVGNGQCAGVEEIGSYHLSLLSGLVIILNNCHYSPSITRGVILVSRVNDDGYVNQFVDNSIQVSRNNMVYFSVVPRDGIFEIDLSDSYTNSYNSRSKWESKHLEIIQEEDTHPSIDTSLNHKEDDLKIDEPQSDIIPIRRSTRTRHAPYRMCLYIDVEEHELGDLGEPTNYKDALLDPESDKWLNTMNVEMQSMKDNKVWDLVKLPRIDYEETFSPVVDIRAIRILIAIAVFYNYEILKIDVKNAFLNGYLFKEQASRQWNKLFDDEIKKFGFTQNRDEPCVYLKPNGSNITFLILYVDDILIMGNNIPMLRDVKSYLGRCFAMKDLGEAAYILGIRIYRDRSRRLIGLCQSAYIEKIFKRYHIENFKRRSIPMQDKLRLSKLQGDLHWTIVKNILKYLRNTKDMFLVYEGDIKRELIVSCIIDVEYLADADDLKSQTRYVFVLNGGAVD